MAQLDFPDSPTLNQQYTASNGVAYKWDGAVWISTASGAFLWTDTGTALTPTDATKRVAIPGPTTGADQGQLTLGTRTVKGRVMAHPGADWLGVSCNQSYNGTTWVQDDATKPSWDLNIYPGGDQFNIERIPAGSTTAANLLKLDNAGNLTLTGTNAIVASGGAMTSWLNSGGPVCDFHANYAQPVSAKSHWLLRLDTQADNASLQRQAPSGGAYVTSFYVDSSSNLVIAGTIGQKASGTTWANPSDIRLNTDIEAYDRGLSDICRLEPIRYTLKASGTKTCGLDAEKVRDIFPECVGSTKMKLDPADEEETEVATLDIHAILIALINAVKELAAR